MSPQDYARIINYAAPCFSCKTTKHLAWAQAPHMYGPAKFSAAVECNGCCDVDYVNRGEYGGDLTEAVEFWNGQQEELRLEKEERCA